MPYTYLLHCSDGSLYCGWTTDLEKRLADHNAGQGAKYTRTRRPVRLAASWAFDTRQEAQRFEWQIKQLTRNQKLALISQRLESYV